MIADRFARGLRRAFNFGLARPDDPYRFLQYLPVPLMPSGVHITMDNARELAVVWACMDAITKAIVSCPWNVFSWEKARKRQHLPDDTLDYLLNVRPNPDMTAIAFKESLMYMALSWGNSYAEVVPDGANRPAALYPLLSDRITPHRNEQTWELEYWYQQPTGETIVLPADRVYHLRGPSVTGLMGDNMVAKMAKSIGLLCALERFASTYFGNNTIIGGVLEYPKTLDDKTYDRMISSWRDKFKGPDKAHAVALLEGGMKFTPFDVKGSESMMIEARKFQTEEICRFFGVPLHKVQHIDRATFNNIEHLGIEFVRDAITPWSLRLEQEANFKLFKGPDKAHAVALLEGGMKFTPFDVKGSESMMIEARKFQTEEICRFFGVPLHKVQHIDRATFNNIEHLGIEFVRDAITPWSLRLEQEANFKLFKGRSAVRKFTKLDTSWLTWGDYKTRMEGHKIGREMGLYSANDILEMEGRNAIGSEGDIRIVPLNMQTYEQCLLSEEKLEKEIQKMDQAPVEPEPLDDKNSPPDKGATQGGEVAPGDRRRGKGPLTSVPAQGGDEDGEGSERARRRSHALITDAVTALVGSVFDRYAKRLRAREADLVKQGVKNGKVAANLLSEREKLRETLLLPETANAIAIIEKYTHVEQKDAAVLVCQTADMVDGGMDPTEAAARLVVALIPAPTIGAGITSR